jgi:drug/metabolite transporter (DMT)-like permease
LKVRELGILIVLGAIWGASYLFIRIAAPVLGPVLLMEGRVLLAGLALLVYALLLGRAPDLRGRWRQFVMLGLLNAALPFTLIAAGTLELTASLSAILSATAPLFTALTSAVWLRERVRKGQILGMILGVAGVSIAVNFGPLTITPAVILATLEVTLASVCYGVGVVYARVVIRDLPPLELATGQLFGAAALLVIPAVFSQPLAPVTPLALGAGVALALLATAFAYLLYFQIVVTNGAMSAASVTFLIPIFGVLWGSIFLHEPIGPGAIIGLVVILLSVLLVTGFQFQWPARGGTANAGQHPGRTR